MSITKTTEVEVVIDHPLEDTFDLEDGSTFITKTEKTTELTVSESYDEKDTEIEGQFQEVYDKSLAAFEDQEAIVDVVEGRFKARNMEIGVQLLNTALAAAKEKSTLKQHKDKIDITKKAGKKGTTNNTLVIADRNDLLKALSGKE